MTLDSTAGLRGYVDAVGDKFEVGTGFSRSLMAHKMAVSSSAVPACG